MKVGDLVKRKPVWGEWVKHNPWMLKEEEQEVGMIVELDEKHLIVHWPFTGISWESEKELEKLNENN